MNRRHFLISSVAALSSTRLVSSSSNDTVRVACVGLRGRGKDHVEAYARLPKVGVAALCDIDESVLNQAAAELERTGARRPALYSDLRKLLDDKSIDVISLATPNHQHALQTVWSCQAGKDVYVEKPCSHDMFEAQQIVAAARRYDRIVQQGSQSRSSPALQEGMRKIREGLIGDVYMARGLCFKWRDTIGRATVEPVPAGVNYDLWLGPAPQHAFTRNRSHYKWHWFWDYGNGDLGNQGIHELDIARWGLGVKYPSKVSAVGGHFMFEDDQETPNTLTATYEFDEGGKQRTMVFEVRHWISNHEAGISESRGGEGKVYPNTIGNLFYGSRGYMAIDGYRSYKTWLGTEQEPGPSTAGDGDHYANFIAAVRSRKRTDLTAEIEEGAASTVLIHLANLSYRLGRTIHFDSHAWSCKGDEEATARFMRNYRAPFTVPKLE